jgi:DNA polymerase-1
MVNDGEAPRYKPRTDRQLNDVRNLEAEDVPPLTPGATALRRDVRNPRCEACPLSQGVLNVCMMGDGPVPADGMIIGSAPGLVDDRVGSPLRNEPGIYLDEILADAGVARDDVYVTSAVKCAPPAAGNRDADIKKAIKPCGVYLRREIEAVKPKVILLMGAPALKAITGKEAVTSARGQEYFDEDLKAWVIVSMHPSWVLEHPNGHDNFYGDVGRFVRRLRGEAPPADPEVRICMTREEVDLCLARFEKAGPFSCDLETQGFFDFRTGAKIWMLALSDDPQLGFVIPLEHPESPWVGHESYLRDLWTRIGALLEGGKTVWHNAKFDSRWTYRRGITPNVWFDTATAAHLLDENRPINLEDLAVSELGASRWGKGKIKFDPPDPLEKMAIYSGVDVAHTHGLYMKFREKLGADQQLARLYKYACLPGAAALCKAEVHGIWLDQKRLETREGETKVLVAETVEKLYNFVPPAMLGDAEAQAAKSKLGHPFGSSSTFLLEWLFGEAGLGVKAHRLTPKKKAPATDKSALDELAGQHPAIDLVLMLRHAEKQITFFNQWKEFLGPDGRLHPFFNMVGTVTGRRSCATPNLHQVPREVYLKSIFGAPPGWRFIDADYSQVELRIAAFLSGDPIMLLAFQLGRDIHSLTAAQVTGKFGKLVDRFGLAGQGIEDLLHHDDFMAAIESAVTKVERDMAKAVNFGFLFGMGARGFQVYAKEKYGLTVSLEEATAFRAMFFGLYRELLSWHARQKAILRKSLEVRDPAGRLRHLATIMSVDEGLRAEAERQSINSPVQGFGGDLTLTSEGIFGLELDWDECRMVGEVHDSILFEVREDLVDKWVPVIKKVMEYPELRERFGLEFTVPLVADVKVGQHWGECELWREKAA